MSPTLTSPSPSVKPSSKVQPITGPLLTALHALNNEIVYVRATSEIAEIDPPPGVYRLKFMSPAR